MFVDSCKRVRIMKGSEAIGLGALFSMKIYDTFHHEPWRNARTDANYELLVPAYSPNKSTCREHNHVRVRVIELCRGCTGLCASGAVPVRAHRALSGSRGFRGLSVSGTIQVAWVSRAKHVKRGIVGRDHWVCTSRSEQVAASGSLVFR
ncbi:auxin-responsive protein [Striga asiatica]|uniref:Auxin-responsive protein n=1 Tax=Striga asiatica TaxID=4170 RepID=A0A5A7RE84_STRAF|nr:auxin-responsive protein [Striga asiatica]